MSEVMRQHAAWREHNARLGMTLSGPRVSAAGRAIRADREIEELQKRFDELARSMNIRVGQLSSESSMARKQIAVLERKAAGLPADEVPPALKWKPIVTEVASKHRMSIATMTSRQKTDAIVRARQEAMWRLSLETTLSLPAIGQKLGGFDHTTVLHAIRRHERRMQEGGE